MRKLFIFGSITALLLTAVGCAPRKAPERIDRIGSTAMGDTGSPRNGEGELFAVPGTLPGGFSRMSAEVTPFEHRVFRIVLENEDVAGKNDPLAVSAEILEKHFNIRFSNRETDCFRADLPGTQILLRRAFYLGPRAVAVEFSDRVLAERAESLKKTSRYLQYRKFHASRNEIILLAQGIDDFKLDTGKLPDDLGGLLRRPKGLSGWNGPYCSQFNDASLHYKKISADSYELYREIDGKRISEETRL